jgi:hypothetical protein
VRFWGQVAVGFEPTKNGFAIRSLSPLGHATTFALPSNEFAMKQYTHDPAGTQSSNLRRVCPTSEG